MTKDKKERRPVIFGEVLFDRFPDGSVVLGGAPFNVAWHLQAFGLAPLFISRIGNDPLGQQVKKQMAEWGMDSSGLQLDLSHSTGTVNVQIENGEPSFDIVEECAYDFIDRGTIPPLPERGFLYHGTLAIRNSHSERALREIKDNHHFSIFVDINLRPPWWNMECVNRALTDSHWAKLNENELREIASEERGGEDIEELAAELLANFALKGVIITQGERGAFALTTTGARYAIAPELNNSVIDSVGAGDAFSSVILLGNMRGWPLPLTLERAQQFASQVVGIRGATINSREFYQPLIDNWEL
ncbi:MAG: carbohydrate kinase [Gammaproteobacteria bacterium]|nr:carbohydrate kinase [Gammaproteobacteria bacterium]